MGQSHANNLGIFTGVPAFPQPIHVGRPNIGDRQKLLSRIEAALDRRWLTNDGPLVAEFEDQVAALANTKHCVAMCNGTVALEIVIRALGLTGEVILPSYTFIATAHALQWQRITPVFCDIDPNRHTLDPRRIEELITPRTSGIIGVHLWGRPCDVEAIESIGRKHNLRVLFDAAHAIGCTWGGRRVGGFGDAEMFSFHATKVVNAFEGGVITTNNDGLAQTMRLMRNFGFHGYDNVVHVGTNGKMTEVCAAMGITSLESMEAFVGHNCRNYAAYRNGLADIPGIRLVKLDPLETPNYQYVVVEVDEAAAGLSRDVLVLALHADNVLARRYFYPGCHAMEPYRSYFPSARLVLPETERVAGRVAVLPTGTATSEEDVQVICSLIRRIVENAEKVRSAAAGRVVYPTPGCRISPFAQASHGPREVRR